MVLLGFLLVLVTLDCPSHPPFPYSLFLLWVQGSLELIDHHSQEYLWVQLALVVLVALVYHQILLVLVALVVPVS